MYCTYIHTYIHTSPPFPTYTHPNLTKTENKAFLPRCPRLLECYSSYYSANHAATAPYVCDRESWHNLQTLAALLLFFPFSSESRSNRPPPSHGPETTPYPLPPSRIRHFLWGYTLIYPPSPVIPISFCCLPIPPHFLGTNPENRRRRARSSQYCCQSPGEFISLT